MKRTTILLIAAVFVSACTTNTIITFDCQDEKEKGDCERGAEQRCGTKNYRVSARAEYKQVDQRPVGERSSHSDITGALSQGMGGSKRLGDDERPRWQYTVECNPRTPAAVETASTTTVYPELTPEQLAARERYIRMYMHEVCELTDPDMRREEVEIARRQFGDVSCPD